MARQRLRFALPAVLAVVVLAAWQLGIHAFDVPRFLVATPYGQKIETAERMEAP